jgi:hypothetical protein
MRITRRGKIVRALAIGAGIALLVWVSGRVWWTENGYCFGSMADCVGL